MKSEYILFTVYEKCVWVTANFYMCIAKRGTNFEQDYKC